MAPSRLETGATLDGFLLGERIHRGGMASIWAVTHPGHDLPLLMKVPVMSEGVDPAAIVGFEMEAMILPRLSGPHVPRFVAQGEFEVQPYLVLERIPGPSLLPMLEQLPLPCEAVAALGHRIATALDDLHRQHVVHLDVKPSNLLTRPTGEMVLVDYGLSHHDELPDLMGEEFRLPYGTAPYMAPEQVLGHRRDPRSDQFALGVLLYFFLTGIRPFGDPQRLSGLKRRLWCRPVGCGGTVPPGCRRSSCVAWRSTRPGAIPRRAIWPSPYSIPIR
jgi:eukaryotic-like serine/threonine-protein kinase